MKSLQGKSIWLTGASSGIGEGLAKELARRGARLALTARSHDSLQAVASAVHEISGSAAVICPADVSDQGQLEEAYQKARQELGRLDIVIANAGTHIESWPEKGLKADDYLKLMDVNYGGMIRTFGVSVPEMLENERGHLVAVASLAGYRGLPRAAAYGASKAAMIHFLESARFHLEQKKIIVTTVCPGFVKTPLTDKNTFFMPFLIDVEKASRIICDGIEYEKEKVSFPIPFNWFMELVRLLPAFLFKPLARQVHKRA